MKATVDFIRNKSGQLEHKISVGNYTLHVIVYKQLSVEQLDYVFRQHLNQRHRGRIPKRGNEIIEIPRSTYIE